ncbi:MAG: DHH family phosphoesterase [candidate division WOR-3 bacterium]
MWALKPIDSEERALALANELKIHPALARVLYVRDIKTVEQANKFFNATLNDLYPYHALPDIDKAIERIISAIKRKEKIVIWGHEDLDGITSVVILYETIKALQGQPMYHIPSKGKDKHGLSVEKAQEFAQNGVKLIITVDCGITNLKEIDEINKLGIDVIITDHHEILDRLPNAIANIDPKRPDSPYPFQFLAGCGIAFKLAVGLVDKCLNVNINELLALKPDFLAYLALGTISDRVPLVDENRILAKYGWQQFQKVKNPAILAILEISKINPSKMTYEQFFSDIVPIFSSANGNLACEYFLHKDYQDCLNWVSELLAQSQAWQKEARENLALAEEIADITPGIIFVRDERLSLRVLGHIAGKLKDRYQLPTLVLGYKNGDWVGECRGINGVDLIALLKAHSNYFSAYGGHKKACGFTIADKDVQKFIKSAKKYAKEHFVGNIISENKVAPEAILPLNELKEDFLSLMPFGENNPTPILISPNTTIISTNYRFILPERNDLEIINNTEQSFNHDKINGNLLYTFNEQLVVSVLKIEKNN